MAKKKPETKAATHKEVAPKAGPAAAAPPAAITAAPVAAAAPAHEASAPVADAGASVAGTQAHGFRRKLVGRVTGSKMNKTVVVEVIRSSRDAVYKKYVRARDRYKAHDETNQYKAGDKVEIQEHRPLSRDKRWLVIRLIKKYVEE
jgi:small subunit ribosomal protein S17